MLEIKFKQSNTNKQSIGSTPVFTGPFVVRVHEPGGTFDTEVSIQDASKQYDLVYHTKYKRIRKKPVKKYKNAQGNF